MFKEKELFRCTTKVIGRKGFRMRLFALLLAAIFVFGSVQFDVAFAAVADNNMGLSQEQLVAMEFLQTEGQNRGLIGFEGENAPADDNSPISVIVLFEYGPADVQVIEAHAQSQQLSYAMAMQNVEDSHALFRSELAQFFGQVSRSRSDSQYSIEWEYRRAINGVAMTLPANTLLEVANFQSVRAIYPNEIITLDPIAADDIVALNDDRTVGMDVGRARMRADQLHDMGITGEGVLVAVLDTGIDFNHPAFDGSFISMADFNAHINETFSHLPYSQRPHATESMLIDGYFMGRDFILGGGANPAVEETPGRYNPMETAPGNHAAGHTFHGTHVAGTIVARDTGKGDAGALGVAPGALAIHYRVLGPGGSGPVAGIVAAIDMLYYDRPDVVNMSLGGGVSPAGPSTIAVNNMVLSTGMIFADSAGNTSDLLGITQANFHSTSEPSQASVTISVSNLADSGNLDTLPTLNNSSSRGPVLQSFEIKPDIGAHGTSVISAMPPWRNTASTIRGYYGENYEPATGTSMSGPHIAGAVALMLQFSEREHGQRWAYDEIKTRIINTATPVGPVANLSVFETGNGQIDVYAAVHADTVVFVTYPFVTTQTGIQFSLQNFASTRTGSFSFGGTNIWGNAGHDGYNRTLNASIENRSETETRTYTISYQFNPTARGAAQNPATHANISFSTTTIALAPGEIGSFTATIDIAAGAPAGHYEGRIHVSGGESTITLPFGAVLSAMAPMMLDESVFTGRPVISTSPQALNETSRQVSVYFTPHEGFATQMWLVRYVPGMTPYNWRNPEFEDALMGFVETRIAGRGAVGGILQSGWPNGGLTLGQPHRGIVFEGYYYPTEGVGIFPNSNATPVLLEEEGEFIVVMEMFRQFNGWGSGILGVPPSWGHMYDRFVPFAVDNTPPQITSLVINDVSAMISGNSLTVPSKDGNLTIAGNVYDEWISKASEDGVRFNIWNSENPALGLANVQNNIAVWVLVGENEEGNRPVRAAVNANGDFTVELSDIPAFPIDLSIWVIDSYAPIPQRDNRIGAPGSPSPWGSTSTPAHRQLDGRDYFDISQGGLVNTDPALLPYLNTARLWGLSTTANINAGIFNNHVWSGLNVTEVNLTLTEGNEPIPGPMLYSLAADAFVQSLTPGATTNLADTPYLFVSGAGPTFTAVEYDGRVALRMTRTTVTNGLGIAMNPMNLQPGKYYQLTVRGRVDYSSAPTMPTRNSLTVGLQSLTGVALADLLPPFVPNVPSTTALAPLLPLTNVAPNGAFELQHIISQSRLDQILSSPNPSYRVAGSFGGITGAANIAQIIYYIYDIDVVLLPELPVYDLELQSLAETFVDYFPVGNVFTDRYLLEGLAGRLGAAVANSNRLFVPYPTNVNQMLAHQYSALVLDRHATPDIWATATADNWEWSSTDVFVDFAEAHNMYSVWRLLIEDEFTHLSAFQTGTTVANTVFHNRAMAIGSMESLISQVGARYDSRLDAIYVVSDAFLPDITELSYDWRNMLRTAETTPASRWYRGFANGATGNQTGSDYIYEAFVLARQHAPNATLFYSDFNLHDSVKAQTASNMVEELNALWADDARNTGDRLLIEGIAMQLSVDAATPNLVQSVRSSIELFAQLGMEIAITELEVNIVPGVPVFTGLSQAQQQLQAQVYGQLFSVFMTFADYISHVNFFNHSDGHAWNNPMGNPALFDANLEPKLAFFAILEAQGKPSESAELLSLSVLGVDASPVGQNWYAELPLGTILADLTATDFAAVVSAGATAVVNSVDVALGTWSVTVTAQAGNYVVYNVVLTVTLPAAVAPTISGPQALTLTVGYAQTYTSAFAITGTPAPAITLSVSGNYDAYFAWDAEESRLSILPGLAVGIYTVEITATNSAGSATAAFVLTVIEDSATPQIFRLDIFNNGPVELGATPSRPNAGLAASGTIRMWTQLDGVNARIPYTEIAVEALLPNGDCAMEFITINRPWNAQNYVTSLDANKNAPWERIYLTATFGSQVVNVVLVNSLFQPTPPPVLSFNIFNNGEGGSPSTPNPGLAASGTIRMWTRLDGVNAPIYYAAASSIVALDQDGQCAKDFLRVNRMWVAGTGFIDYFNTIDVNKNAPWRYINFSITAHGQTVELLLVNANYVPAADYHTVTITVQAGAVDVYVAQTTVIEVPNGGQIPVASIPDTVARTGFYFAGWYPADPTAHGNVYGDLTFTAQFNPLFHNVTFEAGNGGELVPSPTAPLRVRDGFWIQAGNVPTPVALPGFVFVEWVIDGVGAVNPVGFVVRENMTLMATFEVEN